MDSETLPRRREPRAPRPCAPRPRAPERPLLARLLARGATRALRPPVASAWARHERGTVRSAVGCPELPPRERDPVPVRAVPDDGVLAPLGRGGFATLAALAGDFAARLVADPAAGRHFAVVSGAHDVGDLPAGEAGTDLGALLTRASAEDRAGRIPLVVFDARGLDPLSCVVEAAATSGVRGLLLVARARPARSSWARLAGSRARTFEPRWGVELGAVLADALARLLAGEDTLFAVRVDGPRELQPELPVPGALTGAWNPSPGVPADVWLLAAGADRPAADEAALWLWEALGVAARVLPVTSWQALTERGEDGLIALVGTTPCVLVGASPHIRGLPGGAIAVDGGRAEEIAHAAAIAMALRGRLPQAAAETLGE